MVRLLGIDLPKNKKMAYALTAIYGIGLPRAFDILEKIGLEPDSSKKPEDLTDTEVATLRKVLETDYQLEGDLRRLTSLNIKRLMEVGSIRGRRHRVGLPVRGQRTRTNARTNRGAKKTVAGKKK